MRTAEANWQGLAGGLAGGGLLPADGEFQVKGCLLNPRGFSAKSFQFWEAHFPPASTFGGRGLGWVGHGAAKDEGGAARLPATPCGPSTHWM